MRYIGAGIVWTQAQVEEFLGSDVFGVSPGDKSSRQPDEGG